MTVIELHTTIHAPVTMVFDLARSVELHLDSMTTTGERVVAGRTSGLCEQGDTITWSAVHFGIRQQLTVTITEMNPYTSFEDRMVKGAFRSMRHQHLFSEKDGTTVMTDIFEYEAPLGWVGRLFDMLVLKRHMQRFLQRRNNFICKAAAASILSADISANNMLMEPIDCKWEGAYVLGESYPAGSRGSRTAFTLDLIVQADKLYGICKEDNLTADVPGDITVKGSLQDLSISFIKQYPYTFAGDHNGNHFTSTARKQHPILYTGTYDIATRTFSGTWEFVPVEKGMVRPDGSIIPWATAKGSGTWSMKRA